MQVPTSPARKPRNWDILKALEDVSPPSPSPSFGSDFLATLESTGEIPIFLDPGTSRDSIQPLGLSPPRSGVPTTSDSLDTVMTIGTFGPRYVHQDGPIPTRDSYLSHNSTNSMLSSALDPGHVVPQSRGSQYLSPAADHRGYYDPRVSSASSRFTLSAYLTSKRQLSDIHSSPGSRSPPGDSSWNTPSPSSDTLSFPDTNLQSPSIRASLSTIIFAAGSGSASPSVTTGLATDAQLYALRHRQRTSPSSDINQYDFPRSSSNSSELGGSRTPTFRPIISRPNSPLSGFVFPHSGPRVRTKSSTTTRSNDSGRSAYSARSAKSNRSTHSARAALPCELSVKVPGLPPVLSWLQNVRLEPWIDQEGFRLIRPTFILSNYTIAPVADRDTDLVDALTYGSAEFHPVERQAFVFHHGTLDPPPVLRKLTMAGDDSRDYISRQASLSIKANGAYSVSGSENFDSGPPSPHSHGQPSTQQKPLKLTWRFDYLVEDGIGKQAGEKTLTPLAFSCSPGLLHPTHGKKIKIMQVVKKNLTPKLASEKMGDSSPDFHLRVQTEPPRVQAFVVDGTRGNAALAAAPRWGASSRHRRVHSTSEQPLLPRSTDADNIKASDSNRGGLKKNRTASLALGSKVPMAPETLRISKEAFIAPVVDSRRNSTGAAETLRQITRHILPPLELADILDQPRNNETSHRQSLRPPPRR